MLLDCKVKNLHELDVAKQTPGRKDEVAHVAYGKVALSSSVNPLAVQNEVHVVQVYTNSILKIFVEFLNLAERHVVEVFEVLAFEFGKSLQGEALEAEVWGAAQGQSAGDDTVFPALLNQEMKEASDRVRLVPMVLSLLATSSEGAQTHSARPDFGELFMAIEPHGDFDEAIFQLRLGFRVLQGPARIGDSHELQVLYPPESGKNRQCLRCFARHRA